MITELASRFYRLRQNNGWMLWIVIIMAVLMNACSEQKATFAVSAKILETHIVVRGEGPAKWHYFDYNLPIAGSATLRLLNGARTNAPSEDRAEGAEVTLRGESVVTPKEFNQQVEVLEVPVKLQAGINRLGVRLRGDTGKRVSVRIDAPADKIILSPVLNPVVVGKGTLMAQAKVTALGLPVTSAAVVFEVSDLGTVPKVLSHTDSTGTATTFLRGFSSSGEGLLKASVVRTALSHTTPVQAVNALVVTLDHGVERLSVKEGGSATVAIDVNLLESDHEGQHVALHRVIEPDTEGIKFDLPSGDVIGSEQQLSFRGKVTGITAGTYKVTTTATITETGDKWSDKLSITVVDPDAPDPLVIYGPLATPPGIAPSKEATPVTLRAYVGGRRKPPEVLYLHEVDKAGQLKCPHVAELRDNGKDGDDRPGDLTYAVTFNIPPSDDETTIDYRLRAEPDGPEFECPAKQLDETILSTAHSFHITRFPVGMPDSDPSTLVKDPDSRFRLFSNEVVLGIRPDVPVDRARIEKIAGAAGGAVVGFWPPLRLYLLKFSGDGTAVGVQKAIQAVSAFSEVEYAVPNHETIPLAFPDDEPNDPHFSTQQWYLETLQALRAWGIAGGGSGQVVAIVETDGEVDFTHPDLDGKGLQVDTSTSGTDIHATQVAGLIAAIADNSIGIAGLAYESQLLAYVAAGAAQQAMSINAAFLAGAKIINVSQASGPHDDLESALNSVINAPPDSVSALVVIAAGQPRKIGSCPTTGSDTVVWPAYYNHPDYNYPDPTIFNLRRGLLAVGATDEENHFAEWDVYNDEEEFLYTQCTNRTDWIDLYAPGENIYSTIPGNTYASESGTSFSAALTSGAAAVLWAKYPDLTASQLHNRLINTSNTSLSLGTCIDIAGTGDMTCGRLDLFEAIRPTVFSIAPGSASEGDSISFTVTRTGDWPIEQTVDYATSINVGETDADDFRTTSGTLSFLEGNVTQNITVETTPDLGCEPDETFTVTLSNPTGGAVMGAPTTAPGTILNDDTPVITLNGEAEITVEACSTYTDPDPGADVACNPTAVIAVNNPVNIMVPDTYTITYSSTGAVPVERRVTVEDTTRPVITLNGDSEITLSKGSAYTEAGATATDCVDGDLTENIEVGGNVNTTESGIYTLTYDVADGAGNAADQVIRTVHVTNKQVAILIDTSDSMSWGYDGTMGVPTDEQRLTLAKEAIYPFMEMLNSFNSGTAKFGISTFPIDAWSFGAACNGQERTQMTLVTDFNTQVAVNDTIPELEAEGDTPLLAGMEVARRMFDSDAEKAIILLSDGYHNCPSVLTGVDDPQLTALINLLYEDSIRVFTIGFGRHADVDLPLLKELADQTTPDDFVGSQFYDVTILGFDPDTWDPGVALQETYKDILVDALGLDAGVDPMKIIKAEEKDSFDVRINEHDRKVSFYISWATSQAGRLELTLKSSDGKPVSLDASGIRVHAGKTYTIITVDKAFLDLPGKVGPNPWKMEVGAAELGTGEDEIYQYSVIMDSALKMKVGFDKASYGTGDTLTITAKITAAGQPVTGLTDIQLKFTRPLDGSGNWFAANEISAQELSKIPEKRGTELLSPLQRKALFLTDIRKVAFPARSAAASLRMYDDGSHGDAIADDGEYTAQFTHTDKEGTYSFMINASGPTSGGNTFERVSSAQKYVTVNVVPGNILMDVRHLTLVEGTLNQFEVLITPKDAQGNFLGPRHAGSIQLTASKGKFAGEVKDHLDGTYSQILQLPKDISSKEADVQLTYKGEKLSFNLAKEIGEPNFWLIILVIFAALLVIAVVWFSLNRLLRH